MRLILEIPVFFNMMLIGEGLTTGIRHYLPGALVDPVGPSLSISEYRYLHCTLSIPPFAGGLSKKDARKIARDLDTKYKGWLQKLPLCPKTEKEVKYSDKFVKDGLSNSPDYLLQVFHPGAKMSYRSKPQYFFVKGKLVSKISQQCTYDVNGNSIDRGAGAGTPDFASAGTDLISLDHIEKDVKTWCVLGWQEYNKTWIPDDGKRKQRK
jgi:hypothetical protein